MSMKIRGLVCVTLGLIAYAVAGVSLRAQHAEFTVTELGRFEAPWALEFLPDGRLLVSEMRGSIQLLDASGSRIGEISGVPPVDHGGQGGFGDIVLHPNFEQNSLLYFSYIEAGAGDRRGAVVARAELALSGNGGQLRNAEVVWRQTPKVTGRGHYSHRIAFGPDGYLWISSGDRQKFHPSQDMNGNLGKVIRLNDDGSVPSDNPYAARGGVTAEIWSLGHRNLLGLAFDSAGRLWDVEMGPAGGDELNLVRRGANYGYPVVSNGDHYDGTVIPDHDTRPEFAAPAEFWTPVISPSSLLFYTGEEFPQWQGDAFIGGLSSQALIRVEIDGDSAREAQRFEMGRRIRAVEQGPDGALWLLEDGRQGRGGQGTLLKLTAPTS